MTLHACISEAVLTCRGQSHPAGWSGRKPQPGKGEVPIQIPATGITACDVTIRKGQPREISPGLVTVINGGGLPPSAFRTYPLHDIAKASVDPMAETSTRPGEHSRASNERVDIG